LLYFSKPVPSVICLLIVVLGCIGAPIDEIVDFCRGSLAATQRHVPAP